jgi:hypothetical protein
MTSSACLPLNFEFVTPHLRRFSTLSNRVGLKPLSPRFLMEALRSAAREFAKGAHRDNAGEFNIGDLAPALRLDPLWRNILLHDSSDPLEAGFARDCNFWHST